jgi:Zn-dependent protease/CBS domain-containing protein
MPVGRVLGVEVRIHLFFLLLLVVSVAYADSAGVALTRGVMLWLFLLVTVLIREIARGYVALYHGLNVRSVMLLPIGGLFTHNTPESAERAAEGKIQTHLATVGPLVNLAAAFVVGGLVVAASPQVSMIAKPWVTPAHLMRSFVWLNVFLAAVNLLPAYPLDAGRLVRGGFSRTRGRLQATRAASGIGQIVALVTFVAGLVMLNPWLIMGGAFIFLGAHLEDQGLFFQNVVDTIYMRDIMLTEFSTMSPADTLEDALKKAVHSLQDDFPVVRGDVLVGVVSRSGIVEALRAEGNGYIQGIMGRVLHVARPEDSLSAAFKRITAGRGMSLVPVTEGQRIVGIVTLQNLMHSMALLAESRRTQTQQQRQS